ncbi:MAG: hypothetical protein LRY55_02695 [Leadbetterella sp.]|nr:hypothetical protein [Leadbetterella sp.]
MLIWFFGQVAVLDLYGLMTYGLMIFLTVYAYTDFMDQNRSFLFFELLKDAFGLYILYGTPFWEPLFAGYPAGKMVLTGYFILSALLSAVFFRSGLAQSSR